MLLSPNKKYILGQTNTKLRTVSYLEPHQFIIFTHTEA